MATEATTFRTSPADLEKLKALAHQRQSTVTELVNLAVQEFLERRESTKKELDDTMWSALEELLNQVANEREEDRDGPGRYPTNNSYAAQRMIKTLGMERRRPQFLDY